MGELYHRLEHGRIRSNYIGTNGMVANLPAKNRISVTCLASYGHSIAPNLHAIEQLLKLDLKDISLPRNAICDSIRVGTIQADTPWCTIGGKSNLGQRDNRQLKIGYDHATKFRQENDEDLIIGTFVDIALITYLSSIEEVVNIPYSPYTFSVASQSRANLFRAAQSGVVVVV
jgi:hypothetical protein